MSARRSIASGISGVVKGPQANQPRFLAGQLARHRFADFLLGPRHFPNAHALHLAMEIRIVRPSLAKVGSPKQVASLQILGLEGVLEVGRPRQLSIDIQTWSA